MDFETLTEKLKSRLTRPLPGAVAHEPLRATPVGSLRPTFNHKTPPRPSGVLVLLYPYAGRIKFPLTKRADYVGTHGGQISLPGGKTEAGETVVETAIRESTEEIGISPSAVEVLGKLSDFFVIPSNFLVTPVLGVALHKPSFVADPVEVVKILDGDLMELVLDDAIKQKEILAAHQFRMIAPHFEIGGEIVWGATAMMLNELRMIVREIIGLGVK